MRTPKRKSEEKVKRESGPFLVTASGLARLQEDLRELENQVPHLIAEVERTKGHGDFSENAAYQDAKGNLRRTYGRMARLQDQMKRAEIIKKSPGGSGKVEIGSTVVLENNGKKSTFEILGSHESDPSNGRISNTSPLGKALLGKRLGDQVVLELKSGKVEYHIVSVN